MNQGRLEEGGKEGSYSSPLRLPPSPLSKARALSRVEVSPFSRRRAWRLTYCLTMYSGHPPFLEAPIFALARLGVSIFSTGDITADSQAR